jgi:hypothetical protein
MLWFSFEVKLSEHKADDCLPSGAEVRNACICTPTSAYVFIEWRTRVTPTLAVTCFAEGGSDSPLLYLRPTPTLHFVLHRKLFFRNPILFVICINTFSDLLYGLVVRVPGYRSRGPGSISGATRYSEK